MAQGSAHAVADPATPLSPARALANLVAVVADTLLVGMTFVVLLGVFYRYALNDPIYWIEELSRYIFAYIVYLGAALATHRRGHMAVDVVVKKIPARLRDGWHIAIDAIVATVLLFALVSGWQFTVASEILISTAMKIPTSYFFFCVPLGAGLMLLFLVLDPLDRPGRRFDGLIAVGIAAVVFFLLGAGKTPSANFTSLGLLAVAFLAQVMGGVPIAFGMLSSALLFLLLKGGVPLTSMAQFLGGGVDSFPLLAVPFFILAGALMETGGISMRLVNLAKDLVGWVRGGLGMVVVVSEYLFSGISGSTTADVSAIGSLMIPAMVKAGYKPELAVSIVSAASSMGILVPPCIAMIILGVLTGLSVGKLFAAGFLPAAVIALMIMLFIYIEARRTGLPAEPRPTPRHVALVFWRAIIPIMMPIIIFGAILGGIATPTEASAVAVLYGFLVGVLVYREIQWRDIPKILTDTVVTTGMVMFIIAAATVLAWNLTRENAPVALAQLILQYASEPWMFLLLSNVVFIVLGAVLEGVPLMIILIPLLMPALKQLGIDPLHYGIVTIMAIGIAVFLPPIGVCLYVASSIGKTTVGATTRAFLPYLVVLILGLFVITYVPWFTLILPQLIYGR
ncbi:MAG: TRAP transporter large permease [Chloroflexota bacterium]